MFDCSAFGQELYLRARASLLAHFSGHPQHRFYAAAFHHVELACAAPLLLGCQCLENLPEGRADGPPERWDCAIWPRMREVEDWLEQQMQRLRQLQEEQPPARWKSGIMRLEKELVAVCKRLGSELKSCCGNLTPDFAVLILDDDFRLTPKCVSKAHLLRLFPHLDAPRQYAERIAKLPLEQQIEIHLADLVGEDGAKVAEAKEALLRIGPVVASVVARKPRVGNHFGRVAMLLDGYCVRSPEVIDLLKWAARSDCGGFNWPASALATLGEFEFLLSLPELDDGKLTDAFLHPLTTWRDRHRDPLPLSYAPLEKLMRARPATEGLLLIKMAQSSFGDIKSSEVPVALAGLTHGFAGIRRHAAYVLGRKGLGKKHAPRIVAALLPLLGDANPRVQYNALVALDSWSAWLPDDGAAFERLALEHPDEATRYFARRILSVLGQGAAT